MSATPPTRQNRRRSRPARGAMSVAAISMALVVPALGSASAASTGPLSSTRLGAGDAAVGRCDTDGVTVAYTSTWSSAVANYQVTGATVANIAPSCTGRTLQLTIKSGTGTSLHQASTTVAGTSATFTGLALSGPQVAGWAVVLS